MKIKQKRGRVILKYFSPFLHCSHRPLCRVVLVERFHVGEDLREVFLQGHLRVARRYRSELETRLVRVRGLDLQDRLCERVTSWFSQKIITFFVRESINVQLTT